MHKKCKTNTRGLRPSKRSEPKNLRHKMHKKCKTNAKGLRPSKRSEPKNLRHKRHKRCKTNAKGLRPSKRSEPKNLRHNKRKTSAKGFRLFKGLNQKTSCTKVTKCAKITPRGVSTFKTNRTKRPSAKNQKKNTLGKIETWMPERGETFFLQTPRHQLLDPHNKKTKPPEDNSSQERGEKFSQKFKIFSRCLGDKQIV